MLKNEKQEALAQAEAAKSTAQPALSPWLRIPDAVKYSGLSRSSLYELMGSGKVKSHRCGGIRIISRESLDAYISSQPADGINFVTASRVGS